MAGSLPRASQCPESLRRSKSTPEAGLLFCCGEAQEYAAWASPPDRYLAPKQASCQGPRAVHSGGRLGLLGRFVIVIPEMASGPMICTLPSDGGHLTACPQESPNCSKNRLWPLER